MGTYSWLLGLVLGLAACQPAGRYGLPAPKAPPKAGHAVLEALDPGTAQVILRRVVLHDGEGGQLRDGLEESFWPDGSARSERVFALGEPRGHWRSWWPDGTLRSEQEHRADGEPSRLSFYHQSGGLQAQGESLGSGERAGEWRFYRADGSLEKRGGYVGGQAHGLWVYLDPGGRVTAEGRFEAGQRVGEWSVGRQE